MAKLNIRNPVKKMDTFNSEGCNDDQKKIIDTYGKVFTVFVLGIIILSPIAIYIGWTATETTIFIDNNNVIGRALTTDELPENPFAISFNSTDILYAGKNNITSAWLSVFAIILLTEPLYNAMITNKTLRNSLVMATFSMGRSIMPHDNDDIDWEMAQMLPIYPYFANHSVGAIIGNYGETYNHDLKFKIPAGVYVIPMAILQMRIREYDDSILEIDMPCMWSKWIANPELGQLNNGLWEINFNDLKWNYNSSYEYQMGLKDGDIVRALNTDNFPFSFTSEPKKSFNILHILTPVTKYGGETVF